MPYTALPIATINDGEEYQRVRCSGQHLCQGCVEGGGDGWAPFGCCQAPPGHSVGLDRGDGEADGGPGPGQQAQPPPFQG